MVKNYRDLNFFALDFNKTMAKEVEKVAKPLFMSFNLTNFGYVKIYNNGEMLRLSTDENWTKKYFENLFYNDINFYDLQNIHENDSQVHVIYKEPKTKHFKALYENNIWNIFIKYERFKDFCNVWFFAADKENESILDFYINHQNVLKHFMLYFRDNFSELIKNPPAHSLIKTHVPLSHQTEKEERRLYDFFSKTEIKKYYLAEDFYFSKKETECLFHLSCGKTLKEIAHVTHLSPKTIEFYINNMKRKTGCTFRSQLINLFREKGFFPYKEGMLPCNENSLKGNVYWAK